MQRWTGIVLVVKLQTSQEISHRKKNFGQLKVIPSKLFYYQTFFETWPD